MYIHIHVTTVNEKRDQEFQREHGNEYEGVWRKYGQGRINVLILWSQYNRSNKTVSGSFSFLYTSTTYFTFINSIITYALEIWSMKNMKSLFKLICSLWNSYGKNFKRRNLGGKM